jgi:hypothetical protein
VSEYETSRLGLPFLAERQAQKHATHNEALARLDAGLYLSVSDMAASAVPDPLLPGAAVILSEAPDPEWTDWAGRVVAGDAAGPVSFKPCAGLTVWDASSLVLRVYDGAQWLSPVASLELLGVNSPASDGQRFAVASNTSLFTHEENDHRLQINRKTEADTASLIFQTGYAGRAELGLTGTSGLSVKTSTDGASWSERLAMPDGYPGVQASAFSSVRLDINDNDVATVPAPAYGGLFAITLTSDTGYPKSSHSGLFAYDTGLSLALDTIVALSGLSNHGDAVLDGTISPADQTGLSVSSAGIMIENRTGADRTYSIVFLG